MAKNQLAKILASPNKELTKTSGPNGVLSRFFRQILLDLNINGQKFGYLMQTYISDPRNGVHDNKKDQTSQRGNLNKEFARAQMTWKVFCKALKFLEIINIEIVINARHKNGSTTVHSTRVDFGSRSNPDDDFMKLLEQNEQTEAIPYVQILDPEDDDTALPISTINEAQADET